MEANKKKILLVEDDVFVQDIYNLKLKQEGFDVTCATNGVEAIKYLEEDLPDLVLLDMVMPYMDGIEVLEKIQKKEEWKNLKIIMLTNLSEKDRVNEILERGVNDYIIKSHFTPSEVVEKIRAAISVC